MRDTDGKRLPHELNRAGLRVCRDVDGARMTFHTGDFPDRAQFWRAVGDILDVLRKEHTIRCEEKTGIIAQANPGQAGAPQAGPQVTEHSKPETAQDEGVHPQSDAKPSDEQARAPGPGNLQPIEDPTDKQIYDLVHGDPDLTDAQVAAKLKVRNARGEPITRQSVNTRRRALQKMGYKVR